MYNEFVAFVIRDGPECKLGGASEKQILFLGLAEDGVFLDSSS